MKREREEKSERGKQEGENERTKRQRKFFELFRVYEMINFIVWQILKCENPKRREINL